MGKLKSLKMERFCLNYAKSGNATQSFKDAGYVYKTEAAARSSASVLLTKPIIQQRLNELLEPEHAKAIADIQEIHELWTKMLRGEIDEETIVVEGEGEGYSSAKRIRKEITIKDRIKAAELLAKCAGAFIDRVNVEGNVPVIISGDNELED